MYIAELIVGIALIAVAAVEAAVMWKDRGKPMMDIRRINKEAAIIIKVFIARKVGATLELDANRQVVFLATPSTIVYRLVLKPSTPVENVYNLQDDFCSRISRDREDEGVVPDDGQTVVRVDIMTQTVEVNRIKTDPVNFDAALRGWTAEPATALCGVAYTFKRQYPIVWKLGDSNQPHVLIAGTTGSGKTNELMSILLSLALHNAPSDLMFFVIDMKRSKDLRVIEGLPHVKGMAREEDESLVLLRRFYNEMESRERGLVSNHVRHVLIVDELASLTESEDKAVRTGSLTLLNEIGRKGRENNMNMILCTQSPKAEILGRQLKGLLPLRLVGSVTSKVEANVAVNLAGSGAEMLPGRGAMIYRCGRISNRFQAPLVATPYSVVRKVIDKWGERQRVAIATPLKQTTATIATTPVVVPVAPVVAVVAKKTQVQIDADLLREPWKADLSQAEMIRIMLGRPGDMAVNTGGANRKRMFEALELLQKEDDAIATITTTQKKQQIPAVAVAKTQFFSSSDSGSSDLKPM